MGSEGEDGPGPRRLGGRGLCLAAPRRAPGLKLRKARLHLPPPQKK